MPGHLMQHSIPFLLGQIALTQLGGVLGNYPVEKHNYPVEKQKRHGIWTHQTKGQISPV
jgi:hypothetical protein